MKLYQKIASTLQARYNSTDWSEWWEKHNETLKNIEREYFPSGSGFDGFCHISKDNFDPKKITILFEYHIMNDGGYYDGWITLALYITPTFNDFDMKIKWYGFENDRNKVQKYKPVLEEYFYDEWSYILGQEL